MNTAESSTSTEPPGAERAPQSNTPQRMTLEERHAKAATNLRERLPAINDTTATIHDIIGGVMGELFGPAPTPRNFSEVARIYSSLPPDSISKDQRGEVIRVLHERR
jgi:hypothetical protein